jgi:hypothetical protein
VLARLESSADLADSFAATEHSLMLIWAINAEALEASMHQYAKWS